MRIVAKTSAKSAPPVSNTGVTVPNSTFEVGQNDFMGFYNDVPIGEMQSQLLKNDWLTFTIEDKDRLSKEENTVFPNSDGLEYFPNIGDLPILIDCTHFVEVINSSGYTRSWQNPLGIRISFNETKPSQKICVELKGQTIAKLGISPFLLIKGLANNFPNVTASRVDIAKDDFSGWLSLDEIEQSLINGDISTHVRLFNRNGDRVIGTGEREGDTIRFGSKQSDKIMIIYDKAKERLARGDMSHIGKVWNRCEMKYKKKMANKLFHLIAKSESELEVCKLLNGLFLGYVDFKIRNKNDKRKSRWQTTAWWNNFLQTNMKVRLGISRVVMSFERHKRYYEKYMKNGIGISIMLAPKWFEDLGDKGKEDVKNDKYQSAKLERFRIEQQLNQASDDVERIEQRYFRIEQGKLLY